jgi:glycosyltransferase involved in cell wall biosynthesis
MRILIIHNRYKNAGGEDVVFQSEGEMLSRQGHDVDRLIFDNSAIKTFADKIKTAVQSIYNVASARLVKKKIEEFNPEIIHVHNMWPLASPSILYVAKQFGIPVVVTLHNYRMICPSATLFHNNKIYESSIDSVFPLGAIFRGVYRNSIFETAAVALTNAVHNLLGTWEDKVDVFVVLSQFAKAKFLKSTLLVNEDRFFVKPNASRDRGCGFRERENFFLFVGRLTEEKGIRVLLDAAELADVRFVIVGDGPLRSLVQEKARLNPNIEYLGVQKNSFVIDLMKRCKALIFPSLWYEGSPVTLIEALSAGTIIIASRLGAMAEIIHDKTNGLLFDLGNKNDLVRVIKQVMERRVDIKMLSRKARLTYSEHYLPEKNYALLMEAYNLAFARKAQLEWAKHNFEFKGT